MSWKVKSIEEHSLLTKRVPQKIEDETKEQDMIFLKMFLNLLGVSLGRILSGVASIGVVWACKGAIGCGKVTIRVN